MARIQSTSMPALTWSCARMKNERGLYGNGKTVMGGTAPESTNGNQVPKAVGHDGGIWHGGPDCLRCSRRRAATAQHHDADVSGESCVVDRQLLRACGPDLDHRAPDLLHGR